MHTKLPSRRGFTIVELLVVIAVIGILMALIATGLTAAYRSGKKTDENFKIKQLHAAWQLYSSHNNGQLLPGYLDEATQQSWKVNYRYVGSAAGNVPAGLAQTYPWRLASLLDHSYDLFLGHTDSTTKDVDADTMQDWVPSTTNNPAWMAPYVATPGSRLAFQPAFGYNAYYLGGWITQTSGVSLPTFLDATWQNSSGTQVKGSLVAQSEAQIMKPSETLVFTSSTYRDAGQYKVGSAGEDTAPGCAWVVPPFLAQTEIWNLGIGNPQGVVVSSREWDSRVASLMAPSPDPSPLLQADAGTMVVSVAQAVPLRRYNRQASVVNADGSCGSASIGELVNMERWIRSAWKPNFRHDP